MQPQQHMVKRLGDKGEPPPVNRALQPMPGGLQRRLLLGPGVNAVVHFGLTTGGHAHIFLHGSTVQIHTVYIGVAEITPRITAIHRGHNRGHEVLAGNPPPATAGVNGFRPARFFKAVEFFLMDNPVRPRRLLTRFPRQPHRAGIVYPAAVVGRVGTAGTAYPRIVTQRHRQAGGVPNPVAHVNHVAARARRQRALEGLPAGVLERQHQRMRLIHVGGIGLCPGRIAVGGGNPVRPLPAAVHPGGQLVAFVGQQLHATGLVQVGAVPVQHQTVQFTAHQVVAQVQNAVIHRHALHRRQRRNILCHRRTVLRHIRTILHRHRAINAMVQRRLRIKRRALPAEHMLAPAQVAHGVKSKQNQRANRHRDNQIAALRGGGDILHL